MRAGAHRAGVLLRAGDPSHPVPTTLGRRPRLSTIRHSISRSLPRTAVKRTRNTRSASQIHGHRRLPAPRRGCWKALRANRTDRLNSQDPRSPPAHLRCLIVDDNLDFVEAATRLLEGDGITVVGSASNSALALERLDDLGPNVVLVDVHLGHESGFDLARILCGGDRHPAVILTSSYSEDELAELVAASPAAGFVPKLAISSAAIRSILAAGG